MPTHDFVNVGDVLDFEILKGKITAIDSATDTCTVDVGGGAVTALLFYHCNPDSIARDNGAIEGGAAGFAVDDEVVVMINSDNSVIKVIGHIDGIRACTKWLNAFFEPEIYVAENVGTPWLDRVKADLETSDMVWYVNALSSWHNQQAIKNNTTTRFKKTVTSTRLIPPLPPESKLQTVVGSFECSKDAKIEPILTPGGEWVINYTDNLPEGTIIVDYVSATPAGHVTFSYSDGYVEIVPAETRDLGFGYFRAGVIWPGSHNLAEPSNEGYVDITVSIEEFQFTGYIVGENGIVSWSGTPNFIYNLYTYTQFWG